MRKLGTEEGLRELDEAAMAMRVAQGAAKKVQGWLRTVRREVGIPAPEMARQMRKSRPEVFRMEHTEERGRITLRTLRRAAEALGCDLVYGLAPKEGTLAAMAAGRAAAQEQRRAETLARRDERKRERRREAARKRWAAEEQARLEKEWREYWRQCRMRRTEGARQLIPKPKPRVQLWKQELRKALARVLRKKGARVR
jgi:transcriptional regulator with XRE-family HTH domain